MKLIRNFLLLTIVAVTAFACSSSEQPLHEKLNGTWVNDLITVTFDFPNKQYISVALDEKKTRSLKIIEEKANTLIFQTDEWKGTVQVQANGNIIITKEGGLPIEFTKSET